MKRIVTIILITTFAALSGGCGPLFKIRKAMYDQEKLEPLEESAFFADGRGSRDLVEGTIPRGWLKDNAHLYAGTVNGAPAESYPDEVEITAESLKRGQQRYDIYCGVCHGVTGYGDGMVAQRGFKIPPSYHGKEFKDKNYKPGDLYNIVANGFGVMNGYADQIPVNDRWLIVAYLEVLQASQDADLDAVPEEVKATLGAQK
jgi:mono/diheme cytochrome c family protein